MNIRQPLADEPPHALYSPSGSTRWLHCTASIPLVKEIVRPEHGDFESSYAAEGTAAHELLEHCLKHNASPSDLIGREFYGFHVDVEMAEAIDACLSVVDELLQAWSLDRSAVRTESRVYMPSLHERDCFGTVDITVLDPTNKRFAILDLKYGKGVLVSSETSQLKIYGIGVLDTHGWDNYDEAFLGIMQPRLTTGDMGPESWDEPTHMVWELEQYAVEYASVIRKIEAGDVSFNPSREACRWCKAAAISGCDAYDKFTFDSLASDFEDLDENVFDVSPPLSLTEKLDRVQLIRDWCNAVEARAMALMMDRQPVEGYKIVEGMSFRKWHDPKEAEEILAKVIPEDKLHTKKLVSPTQMEKIVGRSQAREYQHLILKPRGKLTIAPEDDKRRPVDLDQYEEDTNPQSMFK